MFMAGTVHTYIKYVLFIMHIHAVTTMAKQHRKVHFRTWLPEDFTKSIIYSLHDQIFKGLQDKLL